MPADPSAPGRRRAVRVAAAVAAVVVLLGVLAVAGARWAGDRPDPAGPAGPAGAAPTAADGTSGPGRDQRDRGGRRDRRGADPTGPSAGADRGLGDRAEELARRGIPEDARVLVVSVDGLASWAVAPDATPTLSRLLVEGAGTLNARTAVEQTVTLPNHTSMVTGERIAAAAGGHGVDWNTERAGTTASGVSSVFEVVDAAGGTSVVLAGKSKFVTWERSWPGAIDELVVEGDQAALAGAALERVRAGTDLTFLHLRGPDLAGHLAGWGSPAYDDAVAAADARLGELVDAITSDPALAEEMVLVVTADHGGTPGTRHHEDAAAPADYTVPFVVWGAGVASGDLYDLNPDYADPGTARPPYDGPQPVRNGDVANLVTALLGLPPVPRSEIGTGRGLTVDNFTSR